MYRELIKDAPQVWHRLVSGCVSLSALNSLEPAVDAPVLDVGGSVGDTSLTAL